MTGQPCSAASHKQQTRSARLAASHAAAAAVSSVAILCLLLSLLSTPRATHTHTARPEVEENKLYVAGLTPTVQEHALRDIFSRCEGEGLLVCWVRHESIDSMLRGGVLVFLLSASATVSFQHVAAA